MQDLYQRFSQACSWPLFVVCPGYSKIDCVSTGGFAPYHFRGGRIMKKRTLTALFAVTALSAAMMAGCAGKAEKDSGNHSRGEPPLRLQRKPPRPRPKKIRAGGEKTKRITILETHLWTTQEIRMRLENRSCMVVSFGTSYNDSRRLTIGAIENAMEKAFPDYSVRRGFTSQIIIDHVKSRDDVNDR